MFGNLNKPTFGATAPSTSFGFGAAPAANANPFGQNQLFGKPTGFGSPSTSTFGQPTNNTLFSSTQAQPTNLFQNANTTFGTQPTTQTGFGTTNLFGTQQQAPAGGIFNTSTTFGQQQNKPAGFGFGTPAAQPTTLFGQQQPQQQQQPAQQQQQASSIFQPAGGSGLFGGGAGTAFGGQQQAAGTLVKFSPVTGTDTMMKGGLTQSINTKHHSITCMKEYENKSFEELRFEDYAANRKGPQQQTTGFGGTPFGAPAVSTAPSLFGQPDANKTAFGQPATAFGQANTTFGQTNAGFGLNTQQQAGGGLFGKPAGLGAPISSATTFGFGANTQTANPFGSTQAKPFGSATPLFGTNTATTQQSAFGTTNMFGKPQDGTTSAFGNTAFRPAASTSSFAFAAPATTQTQSLFNQPAKPAFNQQPLMPFAASPFSANTFGKPAATGFGTTQPSMFGNALGNTLLGNTANKPGLFSNTASTGLFGNTNTGFQQNQGLSLQPQQQQQSLFPAADPSATSWASFTTDPFGNAPHLAGLEPKSKTSPQTVSATDPKELKSLLDATKKVETSRSAKLKVVPIKSVKDNLFDGLSPKANGDVTPTDYIKPNCRRLILKHRPSGDSNSPGVTRTDILKLIQSPDENKNNSRHEDKGDFDGSQSKGRSSTLTLNFDNSNNNKDHSVDQNNSPSSPVITNIEEDSVTEAQIEPQPHGISWANTEYYTLPSMEELAKYVDENGTCLVKGFTVGRKGYGNVYFPDEIDISGLNIEEIVFFRYREINVYPDDTKKPPVGQGLNRRAQVTLDNVYPRRPGTNTLIKETNELLQMNFAEKLRKVTENKNAKFVDYRPETGSWVFKVEHFSRYGFDDSDEEEQLAQANGAQEGAKRKIAPAEKPAIGSRAEKPVEEAPEKKGLTGKEQAKHGEGRDRSGDSVNAPFQMGKIALDDDIEVEGGDRFQGDNDLLQHSMYVDDISEDDYRTIPADVPMHLGYDLFETNKNIQVMKSTLFDDGMSDGGSSHVSIIRQYLDIPEDIPRLPAVTEEPARRRRGVLRPKVEKVYNFAASEVSARLIQNRSYLDMAVFKGKSFRVGWTRGFNFFSLNSKHGEIDGQLASNTIACGSPKNFDPLRGSLNDSLEIVLDESSFIMDDNQIPTFRILKSNSYLEKQTRLFSKCLSKNNNKETRYLYSMWTLADALWGSHEETFSNRRHLLSEWLRVNTNANGSFAGEPKNEVFDRLTVFRVKEAADSALDGRCPNLALIISQLSLTNRTKIFLQEQIEGWYKSMTAEHIGEDMKKIYLLLSGVPVKEEINVFQDVDWKRAFGMHLWYISPAGAPVDVAIELYRKSFEEYGYAERPNPPHRTGYAEDCSFDALYHMLVLYKTRIHRLSSVLNPATHTDDPLDYRLSWLLLQLFLSLDVGIIEDSEKTKLCTSFSNQLESLGEWEYAVFVLLYLDDNALKKTLILGVLDRNLCPDIDQATLDSERRLVDRMHLPPEWIHAVKGNKTLLSQRYFEAFNHFVHAGDYGQANDILVRHLLPGLFINEQYDILRALIEAVKDGAQDIARWNYEAGLYFDFLELQERFVSFKEEDVLRIQMALQSISDRVGGFPTDTDQQKVCAAEMSKRCATVYREVCEKCRSGSFKKSYADFVERLVMPPDYKQIEALHLVNRPECFGC